MVSNTILTHKVQLLVNSNDPLVKKQVLDKLYQWQHLCFRSANMVLAHHFIQDQLKQFFYFTEGIHAKLADINRDETGMLTTSRLNSTYQLLSAYFKGALPSDIFTNLNTALFKDYNSKREALWKGEIALGAYKRDIPVPFKSRSIKELQELENGRDYSFTLFKLPFRTYLGKAGYYKKDMLGKILTGEILLCDSSLQLDKGKIFWLMTTKQEWQAPCLDINIIAEAHLAIDIPVAVVINGKSRATIGSKEEFLYRRLAIQNAMNRNQQASAFNRMSNGKQRQIKNLDRFKSLEKNYIEQKCHLYSRRLIDFCIKYKAGTLVLCAQNDKETEGKADTFLLRNWGFAGLRDKILYKAAQAGINVIVE